jgi:hypothetical protein
MLARLVTDRALLVRVLQEFGNSGFPEVGLNMTIDSTVEDIKKFIEEAFEINLKSEDENDEQFAVGRIVKLDTYEYEIDENKMAKKVYFGAMIYCVNKDTYYDPKMIVVQLEGDDGDSNQFFITVY